jgi:hypothetical protein
MISSDKPSLASKTRTTDGDAAGVKPAKAIEIATKVYDLLAKDHPNEEEFEILLRHVSPGVLSKRYLLTGLPFVFKEQPLRV